jgi:alkanesulfonate monooxygenase SsuD/methylene tetrahydromethanopterin reductase-like flavin-dependent oxidoreductase (luciferase family)
VSQLTFGIYPAPQTGRFDALIERARRAEVMGFDGLWVADETPMAYPEVIQLEAWSLLGALARETSRVRLGTLVSPVTLRHPLLLAMCVSTVDHASDGRAVVGLGVGGSEADLAGIGQEALRPGELVRRLEEQVVMLDALLRGEHVTREDGPHRTRGAFIERPIQEPRPPILVAAQGPRALGVAARHADIWNSMGGQPLEGERLSPQEALDATRRQVELVEAACHATGRDPATLRRSVFAWRAGVWFGADAFAEWVGRYTELGFEDFIAWWPSPRSTHHAEQERVLEHVASDVIPALRRG